MPTLRGLRRRGYTAKSIRNLCTQVGVTKHNAKTDIVLLENSIREILNRTAERRMAVLNPIKVVITNYPDGQSENLQAVNNPEDKSAGTRSVPFSRTLWLERGDFMEDPPKKFFRLAPGREVRLRYAYFIRCDEAIKDTHGNIVELRCTYDPATQGGHAPDGRKVKATLHWVSAQHAVDAEIRLYDHLFATEDPDEFEDWKSSLNPDSLQIVESAKLEPTLATAGVGDRFQFERLGYFCADRESKCEKLVFNRTVTLRETWSHARKK